MGANVLVDTSFLVTLLSRRERNHLWAKEQGMRSAPPWKTCEAVLSETFYLLGHHGAPAMAELLRRHSVICEFRIGDNLQEVLALMRKYGDVPMSFADACLVRMTETLSDPVILTTDADFRIYRRHSRQTVPCVTPS